MPKSYGITQAPAHLSGATLIQLGSFGYEPDSTPYFAKDMPAATINILKDIETHLEVHGTRCHP